TGSSSGSTAARGSSRRSPRRTPARPCPRSCSSPRRGPETWWTPPAWCPGGKRGCRILRVHRPTQPGRALTDRRPGTTPHRGGSGQWHPRRAQRRQRGTTVSYMQGLGRLFNVVPIAASQGISLKNCSAITFVCTGADTFTLTAATTFAGSYTSPGNIIVNRYNASATNGTAAWTRTTQTAANTLVVASGMASFTVGQAQLADPAAYVKVTPTGAGLVVAILHDL